MYSEKTIELLRESHRGKPGSNRGRVFTADQRHNMSVAHVGLPGNNTGMKMPQEVKDKISVSLTGRPLSVMQREAIGRGRRRYYQSLSERQKGEFHRARISRQRDTRLERRIAEQLDNLDVQYIQQYAIGRFVVDFFVPSRELVIEGYGCYWHKCESCGYGSIRDVDIRRKQTITVAGFDLMIIWEHSMSLLNLEKELRF